MQVELEVRVPSTGARAELTVTAPAGAVLADVAPLLRDRVLAPGTTAPLSSKGDPLPPTALLGVPPLVRGALLQAGGAVGREQCPAAADGLALHVVGGPSAGSVHRLTPGELVLGRDPAGQVVLDDPEVSRRHCLLRVGFDGVDVVDLGARNGTTVDGRPVGAEGTALPPGAVLRVGRSALSVGDPLLPPLPLVATGDGRLVVSRPPRLQQEHPAVRVDLPSAPAEPERSPVPVLVVLAPLVLGLLMWRLTGSTTFLLLTLLSPVLVLATVASERRTGARRARRERARWRAARTAAEATLAEAVRADQRRRRQDAPSAPEVLLTALGPGPRLWERRAGDDDVLQLRLGLADLPAAVEVTGDPPARGATATDVPLVLPLRQVGVLGLAGDAAARGGLARWLVAQACVAHSPRDLQVVVLASPREAGSTPGWEWARWLPHAEPRDGQECGVLLGLTPRQAEARVRELTALVAARRAERGPDRQHPAVLVVVDGTAALRAVPGLAELLVRGPAVGVVALCLDAGLPLLPASCRATVVLEPGGALQLTVGGRPPATAQADLVSAEWAATVARALAPLVDDAAEGEDDLPAVVPWTSAVGLPLDGGPGDAERVAQRWASAPRSTTALLGLGAGGRPFAPDLVRDGPHALVAGTTGSGKSELLQTLVASLALGNRPDELTFVLVDYKGGAAFGPCARLPHVVGLVTDLDGGLVERALSSLRAELTRREAVLARSGAADLEELRRRGGPTGEVPRLVLVVDEFASLAEELPDFVGGLVGIAMRGRSLGVHLVLATQRPEGVVSADIRANTNLRVCLAVPRDAESRDVLDAPHAARIPRSRPGRAWARTGHDELTAFQAARVGGPPPLPGGGDGAPRVELRPAVELGDPLPRPAASEHAPGASALSLLVDACATAARQLGLPEQPSPWLPPLPEVLLLTDLPPAAAGTPAGLPPAVFGLVDVPAQQARRPLALDLDAAGHLLVAGAARSGRTTALRTLAGALARGTCADDVHLYAVDHGGGGLACLADLPHTGAVVGRDAPELAERLLDRLAGEVADRLGALGAGGWSSVAEQRAAVAPGERLPHLVLLLDGWESFLSCFQDSDGGRLVDVVHRLLREGPAAGLHVVLSGDRSALVGRVRTLVQDVLLLRLADRDDYVAAGLPRGLVPAQLPAGRGWSLGSTPLVAQVALLASDPAAAGQAAALRQLARTAPAARRHRPHRVLPLPAAVDLARLPAAASGLVVLGVGGDEAAPLELDLRDAAPGLLVAGPPGSGRSSALTALAAQLGSTGLPVVAVTPRPSPLRGAAGLALDLRDTGEAGRLHRLLDAGPVALLVDDAELLVDGPLSPLLERVVREARDRGSVVVAAGTTADLLLGYRGFVVDLRRSRTGVLLCPQSPADGELLGVRLPRSACGATSPGRGLLVRGGQAQRLQLARQEQQQVDPD